ncbi:MAG TPA: alpha/beta hydrolase [Pseudonocardia sp.]|nr:alpha/beta hydrolase [Pseudonocardia sp.]
MKSPPDPSSVRIPGPWRHRDISANGIRLHVAECGEGPLVVLAHGFPEFWWSWRHQLVGLADAGFRVVAVDLRGYGDSDKPPRGYDLWTLAGDLGGLIRALGQRNATVIGQAFGGLVCWTLAALHPRLVRSLVVLASAHPLALRRAVWRRPLNQGRATARYALGFQTPLLPERSLRARDGARVGKLLRAWSGQRWREAPEFTEVVDRYRDAMQITGVAHSSLEYYRWAVRSQARGDGRRFAAAMAAGVDLPVLQVHGTADPCVSESIARDSARWVAGSHSFHPLEGVGRFVNQEAPYQTNRLITDFLGA